MSLPGYTIGIDSGLSGAIALRLPCGATRVYDVPTKTVVINGKKRSRLDDCALVYTLRVLCAVPIASACIEPPVGMTGQSAAAAAAFGDVAGALRLALVSALIASGQSPDVVDVVPSQRWKRRLGVPSDKSAARARATELMPGSAHQWQRAKDHNRAEAACLAHYAATQDQHAPPKSLRRRAKQRVSR